MNDLRTAAQQALEALDAGVPISPKSILHDWFRAALAQQAEQRRATPVMQQALEILESDFTTVDGEFCRWCDGRLNAKHNCKLEQTIAALRAALAQQAEPVEPVAWLAPRIVDSYSRPDLGYETCSKSDYGAFPAYTAPPQRTMVPLTEEEIDRVSCTHWGTRLLESIMQTHREYARAVEKASWEKNK